MRAGVMPPTGRTIAFGSSTARIALTASGGIISAGTLTGSADSAALIDGNRITTLGSFTVGGDFTLFNTVSLTQTAAT